MLTPLTEKRFIDVFAPIYIEKLVLFVVLLTDTLFLSGVSDQAVAGVGSSIPLIYTFVAMIGTLTGSATSLLGQSLGARDKAAVAAIVSVTMLVGVGSGAVLAALQLSLAPHIGQWIGLDPEAADASRLYLSYMAPMLVLDGMFLSATGVISVYGLNRWTAISATSLAVCNIALNSAIAAHLIPGVSLGPREIAVSTVISQLPPLAIMGYVIVTRVGISCGHVSEFRRKCTAAGRNIFRMALPSVLVPISLNTSQLVVASYYAAVGTAAVAALTYSRNTLLLVTVAGSSAMAITMQIYIAHYQGQGDWTAAYQCMKLGLARFIPVVFGFICLVAISSSTFLGFYTNDREVVAYGGQILAAMCLSETFRAVNTVVFPALRGSHDVKFPMAAAIVSHWALAVGCGWLFLHVLGWQLWGVLLAVILAEGFVAAFNLKRWFGLHWQKTAERQIRSITGESNARI